MSLNTDVTTSKTILERTVAPPADRLRRPLSRRIAVALVASVLASLGAAAVAQPAQAATAVSYCFRDAYVGDPHYLQDVRLVAWNGTGWMTVAYGRTERNGCGSMNTTPWRNHYVKVAAGKFTDRVVGETPLYATPGVGGVFLGTGYVRLG